MGRASHKISTNDMKSAMFTRGSGLVPHKMDLLRSSQYITQFFDTEKLKRCVVHKPT